ncbi:AraC family transcriptional regulator [Arenibacter sp. TNZ]|uniref:AraC family transcriptional regulator n=1 Tax=Arenibacter TaxID=178469 RepID=UPI000CD3CF22|nr:MULTISPECIES: AraC family transcriptional regulator [Arenibacter]MCM4173808.1 AraC family transcriptional regulator [Arenibacter sp. TNZ]
MINNHNSIDLFGNPLFSLLDFNTPIDEKLPIPAAACFCYILEGENQYIDKASNIVATRGNVIMSLCGITLGSMLANQQPGKIVSIIVHFLPENLKIAFSDKKPKKWEEINSPVSKYVVQMATNKLIENYISGIEHLFENQAAITDELLILKFKELITLLLQTESSSDILKMVRSLFSEREFSFKEIIEAHLFEPLSVADLSQLTGMSLTSFKKTFKEIFNATPGLYIIDKRTEEVAKRLMTMDLSISQIAYDAGFTNPSHLSKCFQKKYGVSPSQYKLNFLDKK